MKDRISFILIALFITLNFTTTISAQDYTQWNLPEGAKARLGKGRINEIKYSPDGTKLAVASNIGIWIYDAHTGQEVDLYTGHTRSVSFSPDGSTIASGNSDGTIRLWNVATGTQIRTLAGHTKWVGSVSFSPDGSTIASGGYDRTIRLWNVATGTQIRTLTGRIGSVSIVSFSPDGSILASRSVGYTIHLWNVATGTQIRTLTGHTGSVASISFSPDGSILASGSDDDTIRLWNVATGTQIRTLTRHTSSVTSVSFSPDGSILASGSDDDNIHLWSVATGTHIRTLTGHTDWVRGVSFSPDGSILASGSDDETIRLWSVATGTHIRTLTGHTNSAWSVSFSPDGSILANGSDDETIRLWNVATGTQIRTLTGHTDKAFSVSFSPDGSILASGSWDDTIRLWNVATGRHIRTLTGHTASVASVSFSPDGSTIASGSYDNTICLWNTNTGLHIRTLTGHTYSVESVAFSPDGNTIASGSDDETIRLWNAKTGRHIRTRTGHTDSVESVSFSPDGNTLASGSWDGTVLLWELNPTPTSNTVVSLTPVSVASPDVGEQLTFSLNITDGQNVAGYQASVQFDSTALSYVQSENGTYLPTGAFFIPPKVEGNTVQLAASSLAGETMGDGILATITFEVIAVKDSTLTLSDVLLTNNTGQTTQPLVEATQITESSPMPNGIGIALPSDLIAEVAFGPNLTYFVLNAQFPTLTGVDSIDVIYRDCIITLDLEGVPDNSLSDRLLPNLLEYLRQAAKRVLPTDPVLFMAKEFAINSGILDVFPDEPQYFIFPLLTASEKAREVEQESDTNLITALVSTLVGLIPVKGDALSAVITFGSIEYKRVLAIDEILRSTMDPVIRLTNSTNDPGRPNDVDKYVLILPKRVTEIKVKVEQVYMLESDKGELHTAPPYEGMYNLETNVFSAPSKQLMSISDYPPFQLLSQEVQDFLRNHFSDPINPVGLHKPPETLLLPNYPNPFNPETWIPYQLSKPSDVSISIYASDGKLIRTLDLGHQPVGKYYHRSHAAHWDGKNAQGEDVASGVYYYTLSAGKFTATRKMLIQK